MVQVGTNSAHGPSHFSFFFRQAVRTLVISSIVAWPELFLPGIFLCVTIYAGVSVIEMNNLILVSWLLAFPLFFAPVERGVGDLATAWTLRGRVEFLINTTISQSASS